MTKAILYSSYRSSASYRVRIALALKGVEYECRTVNMLADPGEQFSDEFRVLNPKCEVPVLLIDKAVLTQSLPIIEYLDETRDGGCQLLPKDPINRATVRKIAELINSGIQPLQNLSVIQFLPSNVSKVEWAAHWIGRGFQALESELAKVSSSYCVGDALSMADLFLVPQVRNAHRFKVDMSPFPLISKLSSNLEKLDAFRLAAPELQPDYVAS